MKFVNIDAVFLNMENIFTIQRNYETPRQGRTSPAGTHVMLGGLLCPRGGLGTDAAMEGLFMPT